MLSGMHFFLHIFRAFGLDKTGVRWLKRFERGLEHVELIMIEFYKHNRRVFFKSLLISILTWVIMFFEYSFATRLLGLHLGVVEMFFIITFIGMAQLFPIPMAIGVLEAGQISAFAIIRLSADAGIALAFLVRMKDIIIASIGLILLATYGFGIRKVVEKRYRSDE